MKFKIWKRRGVGTVYFTKALYSYPCTTKKIYELYKQLEISANQLWIFGAHREDIQTILKMVKSPIKELDRTNDYMDICITNIYNEEIYKLLAWCLEINAEDIWLVQVNNKKNLEKVWRDYNKLTVDNWVMDEVFKEILIIQVDEKEIIYSWNLKEKNREDQRYMIINK